MRTTIIIAKRGEGYISTVSGQHGGGHQGARCGLTPYDAAASAATLMVRFGQTNPEGGDIMAPKEVLELVPNHLRSIHALAEPSESDEPSEGKKEKQRSTYDRLTASGLKGGNALNEAMAEALGVTVNAANNIVDAIRKERGLVTAPG